MFNKSNLFPKANESQPGRAGQARPTGVTPGGDAGASRRESGARQPFSGDPQASRPGQSATAGQGSSAEFSHNTKVEDGESRLIVGPDVKLRGAEILDCDTLVVEGRVEATMDSRLLKIADSGAFSGKVGVDVAEIHGRFDGELTARSQLIIHGTGRVSGKIRYGKIFIEEGGQISGDIGAAHADADAPAASQSEPAQPTSSGKPVSSAPSGGKERQAETV